MDAPNYLPIVLVSTHSRLKAAGQTAGKRPEICHVSTHSRLKAAGRQYIIMRFFHGSFNTQPPEGGWFCISHF